MNKPMDSVELFRRVLELNPRDYEANIEIAQVYEQSDPKTSSIYYEKALKIIRESIEDGSSGFKLVPPELLVTIGTLRLEIGKIQEAKQAYEEAVASCQALLLEMGGAGEEHNRLLAVSITARFNLGYWHEQQLNFGEAKQIYNIIIREETTYLDAYLRLAYLANKRGNHERAFALLDDAKKNVGYSRPPVYQYCVKGKMLAENHFTDEAVNEFKTLQDKILKGYDSYIVLSVANVYYEWSTRSRNNEQRQGDLLKRANEKYMQVLEYDESNIFAAMGVAIVLAEHNKTEEALEILKGVKEACPSHVERPAILINLAHLHVVHENYESAINLYIKALEMFPQGRGDLDTELYLSKAYYKNKQFEPCHKTLKKLIVLYPNDMRVRFDLAMCLYDHARMIFE